MRDEKEWGVDQGNAKKYLEKAPAATFQDQNRVFPSQKGACGNVPGPKRQIFIKKRRLRQRSNTKNIFFHQKRGACGSVPGPQKHIFPFIMQKSCMIYLYLGPIMQLLSYSLFLCVPKGPLDVF